MLSMSTVVRVPPTENSKSVNRTLSNGVPVNVIFFCQPVPVLDVGVMVFVVVTVPPPYNVPVNVTSPDAKFTVGLPLPVQASSCNNLKALLGEVIEIFPTLPPVLLVPAVR